MAAFVAVLLWEAPVLAQEYIRDEEPIPESVDQVVTPIELAFREKPKVPGLFPWLKEQLKSTPSFLRDTKLGLNARSYYFYRDNYPGSSPQINEAWAIGGSLSYQSGWLLDYFSVGTVLYTSQPLYAPEDRGGTELLEPGQKGYTVVGQLFGRVKLFEDNFINIYRYEYDTPYINKFESRMTPNTFEGYTVTGVYGGKDRAFGFNYGFGYIDKIKPKNSDEFIWMSKAAGAKVNRGVFTGGGRFFYSGFTFGAIDYYSSDIINIFYAEGDYKFSMANRLGILFTAQFTDQRSVGDNLLKGYSFSTNQFGMKTEMSYKGAILTLAYTKNSKGADLQNPWSGYAGYTSVQVQRFNRAGENAFMAKVSYDFARLGLEGVAAYALFVQGWGMVDPSTKNPLPNESEFDADVQWRPGWKFLKGLWFRVRYGNLHQYEGPRNTTNEFRMIVNYELPLL
ncbi:MAG TPA: OprD family outer membrane porin [Thermodesulfobacteriota bacterium]|nr:OprD family outer membrane porin [Thermodesulfobacteriota bacterium]